MTGMDAAQPGALIAMKNTSGLCISRTATRLTRLGKIMAKTLADMTAEERAADAFMEKQKEDNVIF